MAGTVQKTVSSLGRNKEPKRHMPEVLCVDPHTTIPGVLGFSHDRSAMDLGKQHPRLDNRDGVLTFAIRR
jgi:hypothetical protein